MGSSLTNFILRLKKQKEDALEYVIDVYMPLVKTIAAKILHNMKRLDIDECINDVFWQSGKMLISFKGIQSIEFTDVSTVISYEQVVTDELLKEWPDVTPVFYITDDLGHVYRNGSGEGGMSPDNGKTFKGTTAFGTIQEGASQLIIQPVEIASLMYGKGHIEIELEPIVIELKK